MALELDIATVVYRPELPLLRLQARSIAVHADPAMVAEVIVLVNDRSEAECVRAVEAMRADYGPLAGRLRVVPATALFRGPGAPAPRGLAQSRRRLGMWRRRLWPPFRREGWWGAPGWRMQQAVKLAAARVGSAGTMLILDAKNHFLRRVGHADFVAPDGRALTALAPPNAEQQAWIAQSFAFLGVAAPPAAAPAPGTITPFPLARAVLADALEAMEARGGPIQDLFHDKSAFAGTEFMAVYADVVRRHGAWSARFVEGLTPAATVFSRDDAAAVDAALSRAEAGEAAVLSIHSRSAARLDGAQRARVEALWAGAGLEPPEGW